jgi:hypothetical protein
MPSEARVVHNDGTLIIASWERHFLSVWRQAITPVGIATWTRLLDDMRRQHPGQRLNAFGYLERESMFDASDATFQATVDTLKRVESFVAAMVMVYAREGFWSATMRGRLTAMFNESNCSVPYAVHPTLPEAIAWLAERGAKDVQVDAGALAQQLETLRKL